MSMASGPWWLLGLVVVVSVAGWVLIRMERNLGATRDLGLRNEHAQVVYHGAGLKTYPHKMATGEVRWYSVEHDPLDV